MRSLDWYKRDESDVIEAFSHACKRKSYFNWDTDIMSNAEATQGACQTVLSGWGDEIEEAIIKRNTDDWKELSA